MAEEQAPRPHVYDLSLTLTTDPHPSQTLTLEAGPHPSQTLTTGDVHRERPSAIAGGRPSAESGKLMRLPDLLVAAQILL